MEGFKKNIILFVIFALFILGLTGCGPSAETGDVANQKDSYIHIYFNDPLAGLPGMDQLKAQANGLKEGLIKYINSASQSLDIAIYSISDEDLIEALIRSADRGAEVRILTEDDYFVRFENIYQRLKRQANIQVLTDPEENSMHNKYMIIDKEALWTGSLNWTKSGIYYNANSSVLIENAAIANAYLKDFQQMYEGGRFGSAKEDKTKEKYEVGKIPVEVYFSPSDLPEEILINKIQNADSSIHLSMFYYTNDLLHKALIDAINRGVKVKAVWDYRGWENFRTSEMDEMLTRGVGIVDANPGLIHHKYAVIDGQTVITGSANWSNSGMNYNDENILVIEDQKVAQKFIDDLTKYFEDAKEYDQSPNLPPRVTISHHNYQDVLSRIEWRPHLGNKVDWYEICRASTPWGKCEKIFRKIPANHRYFVDDTIKTGMTYYYRMRGYLDGEYTPFSNQYRVRASSSNCPQSGASEECSCKDGADNDNDGYIDCEDYDCRTATSCLGPDWRVQESLKAVPAYISARQAEADFSKYEGKLITVRYKVVEVYDSGEVTFLNSSFDYQIDFTAVVFKSARNRFRKAGTTPLEDYSGKMIEVTGILQNYNGPEIILRSPSQIRILDNKY